MIIYQRNASAPAPIGDAPAGAIVSQAAVAPIGGRRLSANGEPSTKDTTKTLERPTLSKMELPAPTTDDSGATYLLTQC